MECVGCGEAAVEPPKLLRDISSEPSHQSVVDVCKEGNYKFGDVTRGLRSSLIAKGKERRGAATDSAYTFGDVARGLFASVSSAITERDTSANEPAAGGEDAPPPPPRLLHGLSGMLKERDHADDAIASLVADALPSWRELDARAIEVVDVSKGTIGQLMDMAAPRSKTYMVSAPDGVVPRVVALHSRSEASTAEAHSEPRLRAASAALAAAGLAPRRLAEGGDWFIVEWGGRTLGHPFGADMSDELGRSLPAELGRLLARVHAVPTAWYDETRARLRDAVPALARVKDDGSHVWWYTARAREWGLDALDGDAMAAWAACLPPPASRAAARVVTIHGDFHPGNLIRALAPDDPGRNAGEYWAYAPEAPADAAELLVIDHEFTCAAAAVHDLAYAQVLCGITPRGADAKRAFARAYLEEAAASTPRWRLGPGRVRDDDVDALAVDVELYTLATFFGPYSCFALQPRECGCALFRALLLYVIMQTKFVAICDAARVDRGARERLLEDGIMGREHGWLFSGYLAGDAMQFWPNIENWVADGDDLAEGLDWSRPLGMFAKDWKGIYEGVLGPKGNCLPPPPDIARALRALFRRDPSIVAPATAPPVLGRALARPGFSPLALALLDASPLRMSISIGEGTEARAGLLADDAARLRALVSDGERSAPLVAVLCRDAKMKAIVQDQEEVLERGGRRTARAAAASERFRNYPEPIRSEMQRAEAEGRADLWHAARAGKLAEVNAALRADPGLLMRTDEHDRTALYYAALCKREDVVVSLLERGATDPDRAAYRCATNGRVRRILMEANEENERWAAGEYN